KTLAGHEYKVKGMSLVDFGRLELELAEVEMPGLMSCRAEFGPAQPFKGARITGSLHMTIQKVCVCTKVQTSSAGASQHLSSGNTSSLAVAKYFSSGIFITGSENDLSILFPIEVLIKLNL
nr:S-adenosyl-L-homocysteine hydrolase [Tanacetum cinerariifolium]